MTSQAPDAGDPVGTKQSGQIAHAQQRRHLAAHSTSRNINRKVSSSSGPVGGNQLPEKVGEQVVGGKCREARP